MSKRYLEKITQEQRSIGAAALAAALGYNSANTIYIWIQNGKIPEQAMHKVELYFKGKKNGNSSKSN